MRNYDDNVRVPESVFYQEEVEVKECKLRNQEVLKEYELRIQFLSRGCVVHVGCKAIAFETVESAMKEVNEYVNNSYETQRKWRKILNC
jgi:hypothetical protein